MSKSGILKSNWFVVNQTSTRVIDSNALVESKLKEINEKLEIESSQDEGFTDGFMQGIDAIRVAQLVGDEEMLEQMNSQKAPEPTPESAMQQAMEEIEAMKNEALAEIEESRQRAYEEARKQGYEDGFNEGKQQGYEQGHKDGFDSVEEERKKMFLEVSVKAAMIEEEYQKKIDELEPRFIDTLTGIYEHIFNVSLKNSRDLIVYLIGNTMRNIDGNNGYLIHVSKEDYPFVSMQKKELIKGTSISVDDVDIIEDASLSKSECTIETTNGVFDCGLGTQLELLNEQIRLMSYEHVKKPET